MLVESSSYLPTCYGKGECLAKLLHIARLLHPSVLDSAL